MNVAIWQPRAEHAQKGINIIVECKDPQDQERGKGDSIDQMHSYISLHELDLRHMDTATISPEPPKGGKRKPAHNGFRTASGFSTELHSGAQGKHMPRHNNYDFPDIVRGGSFLCDNLSFF